MLQFSKDDVKDPELLELILRQIQDAIGSSQVTPSGFTFNQTQLNSLAKQLAPLIRTELQVSGSSPLNLQSLLPFSNFSGSTTLTLFKITGGGANGSLTFNSSGIITSAVAPT
jgi:hypothetical protein